MMGIVYVMGLVRVVSVQVGSTIETDSCDGIDRWIPARDVMM